MISLADTYRKILNGARIEDTGLDPKDIKRLELFMQYIDKNMLTTEIIKKTGLSRSSIYQLRKVHNEHASSNV